MFLSSIYATIGFKSIETGRRLCPLLLNAPSAIDKGRLSLFQFTFTSCSTALYSSPQHETFLVVVGNYVSEIEKVTGVLVAVSFTISLVYISKSDAFILSN